ncbi:uncharacterized protein Bfra_010100 [Botrytis fragariae]|uniref:Lysine-specific metallo-endopeptidase domain-containing protein n=1 Tax=Botrytis fragariae TaxID=1964551 RepID=A0A8H6EFG7_9HELO|nr:uncharacterized protein Bfra_010100 [Botrytis fragariae]KAF5869955.1 hypothetical protein Bfra_010100 [Botrytis fragariae]
MFSYKPVLLLLFSLFSLCIANLPDYRDASLLNSTRTLFGRVEISNPTVPVAPLTTNIFSIGSASTAGGCYSQTETIDDWLQEVVKLHNAVTKAYANSYDDAGSRLLFTAWMSIQWVYEYGEYDREFSSESLWEKTGERLAAVSQLLNGGGLVDSLTSAAPWIFCGDAFASKVPWDQPAKDRNGVEIAKEEDETGTITDYWTLGSLLPTLAAQSINVAYYIDALKSYMVESKPALCDPNVGPYAVTSRRSYTSTVQSVSIGTHDRFAYFCPRTFDPTGQAKPSDLHSVSSLSTSITLIGQDLDRLLPLSATLYHELFHITDSDESTRDPFYNLGAASSASLAGNSDVINNPESYVYLAMAAYVYQNPPAGADATLYLEAGLPQKATDAIKNAGQV